MCAPVCAPVCVCERREMSLKGGLDERELHRKDSMSSETRFLQTGQMRERENKRKGERERENERDWKWGQGRGKERERERRGD